MSTWPRQTQDSSTSRTVPVCSSFTREKSDVVDSAADEATDGEPDPDPFSPSPEHAAAARARAASTPASAGGGPQRRSMLRRLAGSSAAAGYRQSRCERRRMVLPERTGLRAPRSMRTVWYLPGQMRVLRAPERIESSMKRVEAAPLPRKQRTQRTSTGIPPGEALV